MAKQQGLFKWIGGKRWLAPELSKLIEAVACPVSGYAEPFVGGMGASFVLQDTLAKKGVTDYYFNDINTSLINTFLHLQKAADQLMRALSEEEQLFSQKGEAFYLEKRGEFNLIKGGNSFREAVLFLFLMSHCFNGVYRENSKGGFNVPFNKSSALVDKAEIIRAWACRFATSHFSASSYETFLAGLPPTTLVYADPPYFIPGQKVTNKYHRKDFTYADQLALADALDRFSAVIVSNHYSDELASLYSQKGYCIVKRHRTNIISANTSSRSRQMEELLAFKGFSYAP